MNRTETETNAIINIPTFTKEDFLSSDAPYKFIRDTAKSQLENEQLIQLVRENAAEVGVKNFRRLYSAFVSSFTAEKD